MSTVTEIKAAIDQLTPQERCELEVLLHPSPYDAWDEQMVVDAGPGGKLHQLMQASKQNAPADLREFP